MSRNDSSITQAMASLSTSERIKFQSLIKEFEVNKLDVKDLMASLQTSGKKFYESQYNSDYWECKWNIIDVMGKGYVVSSRHLCRWGSSAASIDNRLYLYGGRGADSRPRNSIHVVDLDTKSVTLFKASNIPSGRDGHSMTSYKNSLIIFGGCEGGKDDEAPSDDLWVVDIETKTWNKPLVTGKKPKGREGHGAGVLKNQMLVYGGKGRAGLFSDIFALNLVNFEWKELEQQGQVPGPRESMSTCVAQDSFYVFGGNISKNPEEDEYTNDLFMISIKNGVASSKKIIPNGPCPKERLSHSMANFNNLSLILYGGESYGKVLSDVWVFSIQNKTWKEILPENQLKGRMTHICYCYKDFFIVFGGMGDDKIAVSDLAILQFGKNKKNGNGLERSDENTSEMLKSEKKKKFFSCYRCDHDSRSCQFFERYPEIGSPSINFFCKVQIYPYLLDQLIKIYQDPFAALLRIEEFMDSANIFINVIGEVNIKDSYVCKFPPQDVFIDLTYLPISENDADYELRKQMLSDWRSNSPGKAPILEIYSSNDYKITDVAKACSGLSTCNLVSAIFKLSDIGLIVLVTEDWYCVFLIHRTEHYLPIYTVIFDKNKEIAFPGNPVAYANINNILSHSHLKTIQEVFERPKGLSIYIYPKELSCTNNLFYENKTFTSLIKKIKTTTYTFLGSVIEYEENNRIQISENISYSIYKTDCTEFSTLVYYKKKLVYWDFMNTQNNKRPRSECIEVKIKDKSLISNATGQLEWSTKTMQIFHDIFTTFARYYMDE